MSGKFVTLSLKVPTRPPTLLHILENSLLEGLVDYKPLDPGVDPRAVRSREIVSAYQLKAEVSVIEDELQVQFVAKNLGLHVARIFANTKEVCHAISFNVSPSGEVEGLDAPPKKQGLDQVEARRSKYGMAAHSAATTVANSAASTVRAVESEHRLSPPTRVTFSKGPITNNVFEKLLHTRTGSMAIPGIIPSSSRPGSMALTAEMFKSFGNSAKLKLPGKFGRKIKARCNVCLRKTKVSRSVSLREMTFCDSCFTNLFLLKSGIDHFMPPTIKESIIQVPVNKRRTKFASVTRELPDINLKGLSTNDIRTAQVEFNKFDMEGDGWLDKVILLPLIKACFTPAIPEPTIRRLISGQPLQSMIANMELGSRDRIHEIEFLSLMAFIARESLRAHQDMSMSSRFTHHDLAMAYAYQHQKAYAYQYQNAKIQQQQIQVPSDYHVPRQPDLVEGVRKSFTDSPLSYYHPGNTEEFSPSMFFPKDPNVPSTNDENENELPEAENNADDDNNQMQNEDEPQIEDVDDATLLASNETETLTKRNSTSGTKPKGQKQEEMENLKLTGDKRADGWMMY